MQKLRVKVIYPLATQAHFPAAVKYRDQLSLKNARDALHHGEGTANN